MKEFDLHQATGLTPQELSEVFQHNPRAYMAVRGAVSEKHLSKIVADLCDKGVIDNYRTASGDLDKDFYLQVKDKEFSLECKNVEVIKTSNKKTKIDYINFLINQNYLPRSHVAQILSEIEPEAQSFSELRSSRLDQLFKLLPQQYRESGLVKYKFSRSLVETPDTGNLSDADFVSQFDDIPITIDFQRTRNSTDGDGDNRRNRYYRVGEIDIVGACLFSRNMEWKFLYAKADKFEKHNVYPDRYSNKLKLKPGVWTSDLAELIHA